MSEYAIIAENIGKEFFLGENTARDRVRHALHSVTPKSLAPKIDSIWAIRHLSFKISRGEAIGVIGHNGAGKSSLLKVLSRVTRPTEGNAVIHGRVGTLLEVGTGFHPELSGRDNIFLSGAILGMTRAEVTRKFDEIVAFAEVDKFLTTPVKRYSSGMYVRLAFAVAAFLDPEILIVDEVLAVGDSAFQRKSLGRLNEAASEQGRTVLFVSHNLQAIRNFCKRVLVLDHGRLVFDGPVQAGIESYLKAVSAKVNVRGVKMKDRLNRASGQVRFTEAESLDEAGEATWQIQQGQDVKLRFSYEAMEDVPNLKFFLRMTNALSREVVSCFQALTERALHRGDRGIIEVTLPKVQLRPMEASLYVWIGRSDKQVPYDIIDENVDLPFLQIMSEAGDAAEREGTVSLPHRIEILPE